MNTKGTQYGCVISIAKGFQTQIWNPLQQKHSVLGFFKTEKEARDKLNEWNFDFFEKNTWMLPRGISVDRTRRKFSFSIQRGKTTVRMGDFDSLNEAVDFKKEFIMKLI